jgi:SAM-dependent methyltransferase
MDVKDYAERNREAWNQATLVHQQQRAVDLEEAVQSATFSTLDAIERAVFDSITVDGKAVAQLCCNNGRELISVLKLGAQRGVGFDIADEAIKEAQRLGSLANVNCDFVRTNVYDIDEGYSNQFDIVYITIGALCWMDDLSRFFLIASRLLKKGGHVFLYDTHPFVNNMFPLPGEEAHDPDNELKLAYSYFRLEPFVDTNGLDYVGNTMYESKPTYSFAHTLSTIFAGLLENGLMIREFKEFPHDRSTSFKLLEKYQLLPMCFTLLAQKRMAVDEDA